MGFHFSGVAIEATGAAALNFVSQSLEMSFGEAGSIPMEQVLSGNVGEGEACVIDAGERSIVFLHSKRCIDGITPRGVRTLTFSVSEASNAFLICYWDGSAIKRFRMEAGGCILEEEGEPLEFESGDTMQTIFEAIEHWLGVPLMAIDGAHELTSFRIR